MDQRKQLEQKLIEKAMKDESFKKRLIENPKEVIETESGRKIPETIKINVLEENPETVYLILPYVPVLNFEVELSEAELEAVAGGDIWTIASCSCNDTCGNKGAG